MFTKISHWFISLLDDAAGRYRGNALTNAARHLCFSSHAAFTSARKSFCSSLIDSCPANWLLLSLELSLNGPPYYFFLIKPLEYVSMKVWGYKIINKSNALPLFIFLFFFSYMVWHNLCPSSLLILEFLSLNWNWFLSWLIWTSCWTLFLSFSLKYTDVPTKRSSLMFLPIYGFLEKSWLC